MFNNLKNEVIESIKKEERDRIKQMEAGRMLQVYSTDKRWGQYCKGEISKQQLIEFAKKRAVKMYAKKLDEYLKKLDDVANAKNVKEIVIAVEWKKSVTWGHNARAEVNAQGVITSGYAVGAGYDKESAAIAQALNDNNAILKILYELKENSISKGEALDWSIVGYDVLPSFYPGVGVSCYWEAFKRAGYSVKKINDNVYYIVKEG